MSWFGTKAKPAVAAPSEQQGEVLAPAKISLSKGKTVSLDKNTGTIVASNGWSAKSKDYDLKALVRYQDGRQVYVGAANSDEVLRTKEGAVVHGGDIKKGSDALETITIKWNADIASVALSSYSARENGAGSFQQYGVFVEIKNGPQVITISAEDTSADHNSYTLLFGEVVFKPGGTFELTNLEMYSRAHSERRVAYNIAHKIQMDLGPEGKMK